MIYSRYNTMGLTKFPSYKEERLYMHPFTNTLPESLARWKETVEAMMQNIPDPGGVKYLTIDCSYVKAGQIQRRGGKHIDGNWVYDPGDEGLTIWDTGGGHWGTEEPVWDTGNGQWNTGGKTHHPAKWVPTTGGIIVASNNGGTAIYDGFSPDSVGKEGDCDHCDTSGMTVEGAVPRQVYWGNYHMIHEAMPVVFNTYRQFVRIIMPSGHQWRRL